MGRAYQLLQLPLPVAQLFVHAFAHVCALQRGDDLQLGVVVVNDVVFQHQAQDLPGVMGVCQGVACHRTLAYAVPKIWSTLPLSPCYRLNPTSGKI